jgi:hypothetical protein
LQLLREKDWTHFCSTGKSAVDEALTERRSRVEAAFE